MKPIFQAFLASCLVSAVLAAICCPPSKWEGREYVAGLGRYRGNPFGINEAYFRIFYDADNHKTAISGEVYHEEETVDFKAIYNYDTKKAYFILPDKSICKIRQVENNFGTHCISDDAQLEGESYLGAGDQTLRVRAYKLSVTHDSDDYVTVYSVVTADDCIPVNIDVWGERNGSKVLENYNYAGITFGISNETVFDLPSYCSENTIDLIADMIHDKDNRMMHF